MISAITIAPVADSQRKDIAPVGVTLRDVAEHAGVSPRTVSNVVNGFHYVAPATRARVQASIDRLDYRPNLLARSLRHGRTGIITLLVPEITVPYFAELAHEIVERARPLGCTVMIDETGGRPDQETALLRSAARSSWVDGILLSSLGLQGSELLELGITVPVVLLGERTAGAMDHVGIDNVAAAREAVTHLLDAGCRRIVAVGGSARRADVTSRLRLKGYRQALRAAGLGEFAYHVPTSDYHRHSGAEAVLALVRAGDRPDGLFCFSDELAVGALYELSKHGFDVPDDVRLVGFDDNDGAGFTVPSLSSVRPDKAAIAEHALRLLTARIDGSTEPPQACVVAHHLMRRETSAG